MIRLYKNSAIGPSHRPQRLYGAARARGFTLSEALVAMTITGLIVAMVMPFFIFSLRSLFHGEQKLLINGDIRQFTNTLMENAREANYFALHESFHAQTSSTGVSLARDANSDGSVNELDRSMAGDAGDFLVLVYTRTNAIFDSRFYDSIVGNEPPNQVEVTRLVGYYVATNREQATNADGTTRRALYSFDTDRFRNPGSTTWMTSWGATFPVTLGTTVTLESLLPPAAEDAATNRAYAELLLNDLNGRTGEGQCFLNFANRTAVVQIRVLHGNRAKRVTNTYNFAITPRG